MKRLWLRLLIPHFALFSIGACGMAPPDQVVSLKFDSRSLNPELPVDDVNERNMMRVSCDGDFPTRIMDSVEYVADRMEARCRRANQEAAEEGLPHCPGSFCTASIEPGSVKTGELYFSLNYNDGGHNAYGGYDPIYGEGDAFDGHVDLSDSFNSNFGGGGSQSGNFSVSLSVRIYLGLQADKYVCEPALPQRVRNQIFQQIIHWAVVYEEQCF